MTEHTQGPWHIGKAYPNGVYGENGLIADCGYTPQGLNDARMITAAPDLLAACEYAIEQIGYTFPNAIRDPMKAAIAKARGV